MQTRQQKNALEAYNHVKDLDDRTREEIKKATIEKDKKKIKQAEEIRKSYHTIAQRFPFLVRQNGLQQTLGFYAGKAVAHSSDKNKKQIETESSPLENAEKTFLDHISTVLGDTKFEKQLDNSDVLADLAKTELEQYMHYTRRCLEAALWYRRFADSLLDDDKLKKGKEGGNDTDHDATQSPS